jgi:hypothetical protein
MTTKSIRERINEEDGSEIAKKPFITESNSFKNTRSCYVCSTHHRLTDGVIGSLFGRNEFFCSQACKDKILRPKAAKGDRLEST